MAANWSIHLLLLPLLLLFHCCYLAWLDSIFVFCCFSTRDSIWYLVLFFGVLLTGRIVSMTSNTTNKPALFKLICTEFTVWKTTTWSISERQTSDDPKKLYCNYAVEKSHKSNNKPLVQEESRFIIRFMLIMILSTWAQLNESESNIQHSVSFSSVFGLHQQKYPTL